VDHHNWESVLDGNCSPLDDQEEQGAEARPVAVGAMADGLAEREIFPEGEDGDEGGGNGDDSGGGVEDDADDNGD